MAKTKTRTKDKTKTIPWDSATHLKTDADIADYLDVVFEAGDAALITRALDVVARAKGKRLVRSTRRGLKALLATVPLEGIDLSRARDRGRKLDL
jgi:hypothetical protein